MKKEEREDFCGMCAIAPLALGGAGASVYGSGYKKGTHKKRKFVSLCIGIAMIVLSIIIALYYYFKKDCGECK